MCTVGRSPMARKGRAGPPGDGDEPATVEHSRHPCPRPWTHGDRGLHRAPVLLDASSDCGADRGVAVRFRRLALWLAVLAIPAVAISRVSLGVHFLGDILGGIALGLAVAGLVLAASRVRFLSHPRLRERLIVAVLAPSAAQVILLVAAHRVSDNRGLLTGLAVGYVLEGAWIQEARAGPRVDRGPSRGRGCVVRGGLPRGEPTRQRASVVSLPGGLGPVRDAGASLGSGESSWHSERRRPVREERGAVTSSSARSRASRGRAPRGGPGDMRRAGGSPRRGRQPSPAARGRARGGT